MLTQLYRHCLIPWFETRWKGRKTFSILAQLEESQWYGPERLAELQRSALRGLLHHAFHTCPYYARSWAQLGLRPDRLGDLSDFARWPTIDRQTIRSFRSEMRSRQPGLRLLKKATGGSSGVPLEFDLDTNSDDRRYAAWHRGYGWAGAEPGTKQFYLWGVPLCERSWAHKCKDHLYNRLYRRRIANTFGLSDDKVLEYFASYNRYQPDVVVAYTNALHAFARMLRKQGLVPYSPRALIVGAEKLHAHQRQEIERVFRAPVFETYGAREFMLIGAECERHEGLHLTSEHLLVEILDDEGQPVADGEEGNVVVTDLYNYGMPFIRYANGDRALAGWKQCSCGRGLPLLRQVVGRRLDVLRTPDGRAVPGEFFPHLLKDIAGVRQFQVIQDAPAHVELRIVPDKRFTPDDRQFIARRSAEVFGPEVVIDTVLTEEIPLTRSGKLQVVVNRCAMAAEPGVAGVN